MNHEAARMRRRFRSARKADRYFAEQIVATGLLDAAREKLSNEHFMAVCALVFVDHYAMVLPEDEAKITARAKELASKYGWKSRADQRYQ